MAFKFALLVVLCIFYASIPASESASGRQNQEKNCCGKTGPPGLKGEPGTTDEDTLQALTDLKGQLDEQIRELTTLHQLVEALNASNNELRRAVIGIVDGWYAPLNGYEYKVTPNNQTWDESRVICQGWGGDLAVHGIQTLDSRNNIIRALSLTTLYWIGVNDKENEGTWKWVNGDDATNEQILWGPHEPNSLGNNDDCALIIASVGRSDDYSCSYQTNGLCEKPI